MTPRCHQRADETRAPAGSARAFLRFAGGFWRDRKVNFKWPLLLGIAGLLAGNLCINMGLNQWQRWFFDMLENRDGTGLLLAIAALISLVLVGAAFAVGMVKCQMTLQLTWREWVTRRLLDTWSVRSRSADPQVPTENHGSPEYRLTQDVRLALEPVVELSVGFSNALVLALTFISLLAIVGGDAEFSLFGFEVRIPAYLALSAALYALLMSSAMTVFGQPLIRRVEGKNEAESQFLFEITRAVESPHPSRSEETFAMAAAAFDQTLVNWRHVIREHCRLTWLTNSNTFLGPALPLLLTAPKYINGTLSLGQVMQLASAFTVVLGALNWLTDNYFKFAEWSASARRVDELHCALAEPADRARAPDMTEPGSPPDVVPGSSRDGS